MKQGNIVKITVYYHSNPETFLAVLTEVKEDSICFISSDNVVRSCKKNQIIKISFVRGLSAETRQLFKERYLLEREISKKQDLIDILKRDIYDLKQKNRTFESKLADSMGILTLAAFASEIIKYSPECLKEMLDSQEENYNCYVTTEMGSDKQLCYSFQIEHTVYIQKYCRSASFLYEEYDGTMQFTPDCEEDKNYKALIKKYESQCKLPLGRFSLDSALSLGDKDWLIYYGYYSFNFPIKKLTKDYAAIIAKKAFG